MIKSLYVRVVITFIATVILSLLVAFLLATLLNKNQVTATLQEELITNGKQIIQNYEQSAPASVVDFFNKGVGMLPIYKIQIYDEDGKAVIEHSSNKLEPVVLKDQLDHVLKGGVYRGEMFSRKFNGLDRMLVGLPFQANKASYALFISPNNSDILQQLGKLLHMVLVIVLVVGSLFIVLPTQALRLKKWRLRSQDRLSKAY